VPIVVFIDECPRISSWMAFGFSPEARLELWDRIRRMERKLETAAETVDAIHSGLERMGS
jgi:hypothetical protein